LQETVPAYHMRARASQECLKLTAYRSCGIHSGSKFLKSWMEFLEENADLRYPDLDDVLREE